MLTKICTKCGEELPATSEYFAKQKQGKFGLRGRCKKCKNEEGKEYYKNNIDKEKAYTEKYRIENKEKIKKYYENNKEKIAEYNKRYRELNKEKIIEDKNKYRELNKEKISQKKKTEYMIKREEKLEHQKKYYKANKDKVKEYKKQYNKEHIYKARFAKQKRKSIKMNLPHNLTLKQWNKIKTDFNNKCAYCGRELPLAQEHFIPLSKGGEYTVNNIIPACQSCNSSKHNKDFFGWYPNYEYYSKEREQFILKYLGYKEDKQQLKII